MQQNRGALKLLVIFLIIACAYQLSFSFVTRRVEKKAATYAAQFDIDERLAKRQSYLDSMKSEVVYNIGLVKFTYSECKEKEINLGLDLKGGMNVMLEIAVEDVVVALSNDNQDPDFLAAVDRAREEQKKGSEDFIGNFARAYRDISGGKPLALIFTTPDLKEFVRTNSSDDDVVKVLRDQANSAIANSFNVLRNRIDRFGVTQPNIQRIEGTGRILVELPGVQEPERVRKLLQGTASLEFWPTYTANEALDYFLSADQTVREILRSEAKDAENGNAAEVIETAEAVEVDETVVFEGTDGDLELLQQIDEERAKIDDSDQRIDDNRPLTSRMMSTGHDGPVIAYVMGYDTAAVTAYLSLPQVKNLFPRDMKFMWGVSPYVDQNRKETNMMELYAIKVDTRDGRAPLDGGSVANARADYQEHGGGYAAVSMRMTGEGASKWARLTADNVGNSIAIVLDDYVYSAPRVNEEITGGNSSITGNFTINEATDLANVLNSGKLPAPARIIQDTVVGPSLGKESITASMISFILAFILVLAYMVLFYSRAGLVASVALVLNLFFLFGFLVSFSAVLTLPGIAGIVLTMGMAIDANVIIYERIKEELRAGKSVSTSLEAGYKNALSAIIDANLTTMIVSVVLYFFGTGPVQGFATTLFIGIITSFFTSVFVTRMIFNTLLKKEKKLKFSQRFSEDFLANTKIDFIKIRKYSYAISVGLIVICITSFFVRGMNYGVDFTGGRAYVVRFDQNVTADEVRDGLNLVFMDAPGDASEKSFEVKQFGAENQMRIVTQYRADDDSDEATTDTETLLYQSLRPLFKEDLTQDEFSTTATNPNGIISADKVGASIASETVTNSFIAVLFSLFAIGVYIVIRFRNWYWGAGSVVALAHDGFLTIGLFSIFYGLLPFNMEIDQQFIAAVLTIIGYSINDKVVIFDRIREYQTLYPDRRIKDNINNAVNSTLARTINTSASTVVVLLAIFLFGGEVIRGFVFAIMFGVAVGSLSSIFTATPVAYDLMPKSVKGDE